MWVPAGLLVLAVLDAAFAGFRSSCGRSGHVRHRRANVTGFVRGLMVGAALLAPVALAIVIDAQGSRQHLYLSAGQPMLAIYAAYGVPVLLAIGAYLTLSWRRAFLATAVLLGPLTLVRPVVAVTGAAAAAWASADLRVGALALAAVAAVLAVEPVVDRLWYARPSWPADDPARRGPCASR